VTTGISSRGRARTCRGIPREVVEHSPDILPNARPVKQPLWCFDDEKRKAIGEEIAQRLAAVFIKEVFHLEWIANPVLVQKKNGTWRMCINYTSLNKACPKVPTCYRASIKWST
jgi:hypothetical protein